MLLRILPRFQEAYRSLAVMEQREGWSRGEIDSFQVEAVNSIWSQARVHVPYYRRLAQRGLPDRFISLEEFQALIPVLSRQTVRENPRDFFSDRPAPGHWTRTGGATATPTDVFWADASDLVMLRGRYRFLASWGIDIFDPMAMLWGHSSSFKPGLKGWIARRRQPIEDWLRNRLRLSAYSLGRSQLHSYLQRIAAFRPVSLYGYCRALALLAEEAMATGFHCDSLRLAVLTGEPAVRHLVETIEREFRVPAVVEYGSVECGFLAGEAPDRTLRVREDHLILETLPAEPGKYRIVVSILTNPSFPLLRYDIGDLTDAPLTRPQRGMAILKSVIGRNNDLVMSRSGEPIHSARFDAFFKYETDAVRRFHISQRRDGSLRVLLELHSPKAASTVTDLAQKVGQLVGGYPVRIEVVDQIPLTPAGKHRLVLSEMDLLPA